MSEEKKKVKNRKQKSSKLMRWLHTEGRRYCAIALCASLIAGNLANLAVAADDDPDYKFQLDRVALYEALQQAVAEGNTVDSDFGFEGADADTYEISMAADGSLYELTPEIDDNDGKLKLRVFARLDENIELVDDISDEIGAENASYEIDGSEAFYFLLTNSSDTEQTAVIRVGEKETELIYVIPHSAVEMPEPEGKAVSSAQDQVIQAGAEISQEAGPGITDATAEGETADIVTVGGSGSSGGSGGGGGSSGGNASGKNPTESVEIETEAPVDNTEAAIQPETKPDTEAESTETETEVPEIEIPDMEVPEIEVPEANAPEIEAPETDAPEIESAEQETPKADASETDAANPEPVQPEAPAESEDSTEAEADVPEINVPDEAPEADVEIQIDNEPEADMDVEESEVSVVDGSKSNDVAAQDTVTDNVDVSDGSADDAVADDTSEEAGDVESADSAAEVTAAITLHETCRVAASKAIQSDATPSDAEKATPSDATPSDEAKDTLDGTVLNAVRLGDDSAVVFVTTMDELELEVAINELPETSDTVRVYVGETENVTVVVRTLKGTFSENVSLEVTKLEEHDDAYKNAEEALTKDGTEYDGMMALDICFLDSEGNEIEPENERDVWVSIQMKNSFFPQNVNYNTLSVQHLKENEDGSIELEHVADTADATDGTVTKDDLDVDSATTIAEFSVKSFSTFAISWQDEVAAVAYNSYTVTFDIGEEAKTAGVEIPELVATSEETGTVESLPTPVWNDADGKPVWSFGGWYYDEEEFDTKTVVDEDIIVVAKWVSVSDASYHVNFYNQTGDTVLLTVAVEEGQTVSSVNAPQEEMKIFRGWSTTKQGTASLDELVAYDFAIPVSNALTTGKTLNLYAWYGDAVIVSFVSNGGIAVPTEIIASGEKVEEPVTTREGYEFIGWSTSKDEYVAFDFDTILTENITLYAFWEAQMVPVTLVYMYENADDDGYTPAGISKTVYAPAGSYVSVDKSTITQLNQMHALKYSEVSGGTLTGNVLQTATGNAATIPDVSETYFQYNSASNNRQVMPDGSTVVLVYYNRARITLTFTYSISSSSRDDYPNGSYAYLPENSYTDAAKYNVNYVNNNSTNPRFTYSFTAKYKQNIVPVWPQVAWVKHNSTGNKTFRGWRKPSGTVQATNMYTLESDLFSNVDIDVSGQLVGSGSLPAVGSRVTTRWLIYARTTLPGENADFSYKGSSYTIYLDACQKMMTGGDTGYKALDGCTSVSGEPDFEADYQELSGKTMTSGGNSVTVQSYSSMQAVFDAVFPNQINKGSSDWLDENAGDSCEILLYDRSTISLTIHPNDDTYDVSTIKDNYLYGDWIYNADTDLLKNVESKMKKTGYTFAGWYTDPNFIDGTQYVPTADSRIYENMELYAKWDRSQFKAEFYLYMDDVNSYRGEGFAEGGKLTNWLVPQEVQESFVGWHWYQDGKLQPFDFSSTVGANHVDESGVIKLYAVWEGTNGKVGYLPGIGGDNDTQAVYDSREFAINEASVELPNPNSVWIDGIVPDEIGLIFVGWKAPNGAIYQPGRYVLVTRELMQFEAQWTTDAVTLIYNANGGDGEIVTETWERNSVVDIWDNMDIAGPHFTREGYELIGWGLTSTSTTPDYFLGKGTITLSADVTNLYAIWEKQVTDVNITKLVSGILGDRSKLFGFEVQLVMLNDEEEVTCKLDADTGYIVDENGLITFDLSHNESVTLKSVPIGATLVIKEINADGYDAMVNLNDNATVTGTGTINSNSGYSVIVEEGLSITVTNDKTDTVDTGILLDSMPYVLILAAVIAGAAFYFIRKKKEDEDDLD